MKLKQVEMPAFLYVRTEDFMKSTDKKKDNKVLMSLRISAEDKEQIEEKARKTGLTTSEFIRRCALGRKLPCYGDTSLLKEYSMQLGKIGSNLNQIAKHLNSGGSYFSVYGDVKEAVKELLDLKFKILPRWRMLPVEESTDERLKRMVKYNGDYKAYFCEEQILLDAVEYLTRSLMSTRINRFSMKKEEYRREILSDRRGKL